MVVRTPLRHLPHRDGGRPPARIASVRLERLGHRGVPAGLGNLEVALRNANDRALTAGIPAGGRHWVFDPARYFPARWRTARNGVRYNANREPQRLLAQATQAALTAVQAAARASG